MLPIDDRSAIALFYIDELSVAQAASILDCNPNAFKTRLSRARNKLSIIIRMAIFVYPDNRRFYYIKRVIALPGDKVAIDGNTVSINGERLSSDTNPNTETIGGRSWQVQWSDENTDGSYAITVKPGHAFVLGDNRSASNDSRVFGQVPLSDIVGKARQIWFSKSEDGIRWSRIGQILN